MAQTPVNLGMQSNPARVAAAGAARLINCYAEDAGDEAKIRFPLFACDGFESFATLTDGGPVRAMLRFSDSLAYVVAGTRLFTLTPAGVVTSVATDIAATGRVTMARNRRNPPEIAISAGGHYYVFDTGDDTLTDVDLSGLETGALIDVKSLDGYFVLLFDNGEFFISGIDDGKTLDGLDYDKAESQPDGLNAGAVWGRDVVLFGPQSTEFWQNTGASPFAFERTAVMSVGCYAPGSVVSIVIVRPGSGAADNVIWAATDGDGSYAGVMMLDGYSGTKISTLAVDRSITGEPDKDSITATKWTSGGHVFYVISGASFSWCYDTSTGFWHERTSVGKSRWRGQYVMAFAGANIVSDFEANAVFKMHSDAHDEAGVDLVMTVRPPAIQAYPNKLRFNSVYLDTIPGVGLASGDPADTDPVVTMRHSNDNGVSWTAPRAKRIGTSTEKARRVKWLQIGQSGEDGKLFEFQMSAKVIKGLTGASVDCVTVKG